MKLAKIIWFFILSALGIFLTVSAVQNIKFSPMAFGVAPGVHCFIKNELPDPNCTPGATLNITKDKICVSGYSKGVRNVPQSLKDSVKAAYGASNTCKGSACEVDHLISLELGGSNEQKNLWPQPAPDFHIKDALENLLHSKVCDGEITLIQAQMEIGSDWKSAAAKYGLMEGNE